MVAPEENLLPPEKALILSIQTQEQTDEEIAYSLTELEELLATAGIETVGRVIQKRSGNSRALYMGTGKLEEIALTAEELGASLIVADDELSALQCRVIEEAARLPVRDRTFIILEIFARHASSREGKLQVELARTQYRLTHLAGDYDELSRQQGGIGAKGPGETQIEKDRRVIKGKIKKIRDELEKVVQTRELQTKRRAENLQSVFSLVGYTNAGKSTLLNLLTGSDVRMFDGLFTTLDPSARRLDLDNGRWVIISDTVGFIRKLPHRLINAFRATLDSVTSSELLLIVCDASDPAFEIHLAAVKEVLNQIKAADKEYLHVFNKIDLCSPDEIASIQARFADAMFISARTGIGIDSLKKKLDEIARRQYRTVELAVPSKSELIKDVMQNCLIKSQEWGHGVVKITAEVPLKLLAKVERFVL